MLSCCGMACLPTASISTLSTMSSLLFCSSSKMIVRSFLAAVSRYCCITGDLVRMWALCIRRVNTASVGKVWWLIYDARLLWNQFVSGTDLYVCMQGNVWDHIVIWMIISSAGSVLVMINLVKKWFGEVKSFQITFKWVKHGCILEVLYSGIHVIRWNCYLTGLSYVMRHSGCGHWHPSPQLSWMNEWMNMIKVTLSQSNCCRGTVQ